MDSITKEHREAEDKIKRDVEEFLKNGGVIEEIPRGIGKDTPELKDLWKKQSVAANNYRRKS